MTIKTKRWNDIIEKDDGWRILISRYRPRALLKKNETWDDWFKELGPSVELHAAAYGKNGPPIQWENYRKRYLKEMRKKEMSDIITCLAKIVNDGGTITLLCSSACIDERRCHRSLLRELIELKIVNCIASSLK